MKFTHEINSINLPFEQNLKTILHETSYGTQIKSVFDSSAAIEKAVLGIARMLTPFYPNRDGKSLAAEAIRDGYIAYILKTKTSFNLRDLESVFIETMVTSAAAATDVAVFCIDTEGESSRWTLFDMPLTDWLKRKNIKQVIFTSDDDLYQCDETAAKIVLAAKVIGLQSPTIINNIARGI